MTNNERIESALEALGLSLAPAEKLVNYLNLLMKWQRSISLVATRDAATICDQHIADCLQVVAAIDDGARVLDVGSGAGLPGAIVAIVRPACEVTALEPIHKKRSFLAAVRREVPAPNFAPLAERVEEHQAHDDFEPYDVAVSRATWALPLWLQTARPLVRPGGLVLGMEGAEKHAIPDDAERRPYQLGNRTRALIAWRPS